MSARRTSYGTVAGANQANISSVHTQHTRNRTDSSEETPSIMSMPRCSSSQGTDEADSYSTSWQHSLAKKLGSLKENHKDLLRDFEDCIDNGELLAEWCEAKQMAGVLAKDVKINSAMGYVKSRRSWNAWMQPGRSEAPLDALLSRLSTLKRRVQEELPACSACGACGRAGVEAALASESESEEVVTPFGDRTASSKSS